MNIIITMSQSCTEPLTYNSSSADYLAYKKWRKCKSDNDSATINGSSNISPVYNINYIPLIVTSSSSGTTCSTSTTCTTTTNSSCSGTTVVDCSGTETTTLCSSSSGISTSHPSTVEVDDYRTIIHLHCTNLANSSCSSYFASATPPNNISCTIISYTIPLNTIIHLSATIMSTVGSSGTVTVSAQNIDKDVAIVGENNSHHNLMDESHDIIVSLDENKLKIAITAAFGINETTDSCSAEYTICTISLCS